jgi:hypothetical protein
MSRNDPLHDDGHEILAPACELVGYFAPSRAATPVGHGAFDAAVGEGWVEGLECGFEVRGGVGEGEVVVEPAAEERLSVADTGRKLGIFSAQLRRAYVFYAISGDMTCIDT